MIRKKRIPIGLAILIIIGVVGIGIYLINRQPAGETFQEEIPTEATPPLSEEQLPEEKLEGEVIDQLTADLKGTGQLQLVTLIAQALEDEDWFNYFVRIYTDARGEITEWESSPIESSLAPGGISTIYNPATNRLTIQHEEGAGAHGSRSQFIHWTGFNFEEIKAIDENGIPVEDPFFGDGGGASLLSNGEIWVGFRNYDCPLSAGIIHKYKWNGTAYQLTETEIQPCPPG
jgi:hypothetical protein